MTRERVFVCVISAKARAMKTKIQLMKRTKFDVISISFLKYTYFEIDFEI